MTSAVSAHSAYDQTNLPHVLRRAGQLGVLQIVLVFLFSMISRFLDGAPELVLRSLIVLAGLAATTLLPGIWTRARTVEGIAGAAGIGLGATAVFTVLDALVLQPLGTYTNRWLEIGGGSNWWYLPVWWMAGTFLPWMGAFALANQTVRRREASPAGVMMVALILSVVLGGAAMAIHFPGASLGLGTFAVAFLPAIALTALVTGLGAKRS